MNDLLSNNKWMNKWTNVYLWHECIGQEVPAQFLGQLEFLVHVIDHWYAGVLDSWDEDWMNE